jgi:hypothetical protein
MTPLLRIWSIVVISVGLWACEGQQPIGGGLTTGDSAGIQIVAFDPARVVVPTAELVPSRGALAAALDTFGIDRLAGVFASTDSVGNTIIAIGDNGRMTVSVLNGDGAIIERFGRRGQGPGEFADLRVVGLSDAGHVVINDPLRQRLSWTDVAGNEMGTLGIPGTGWGAVIPVGSAADGSLLVATHARLPEPVATGTVRPEVRLRRIPPLGAGESLDFGVFPGDAIVWKAGGPDGPTMGEAPFGMALLATAVGRTTTVAGADDDALRVLDAVGRLHARVRLEGKAIRVTNQAIAAYRSSVASRVKGYEAEWAMLTSDDVFPKSMPRVARLLSEPSGRRWVFLHHDLADQHAVSIVLDTMNLPILRVTMPSSVRPLAMLNDRVIGLITSDEGAERLTVLELRRH